MLDILKAYQNRLTNLSGSNRSLLLMRLSASQDIDLHELDFVVNEPSFSIVEALIARKKKTKICDVLDIRNETINEKSKQLRRIFRREKFIYDERGAKDLYVGWPMVKGRFSDGTLVRAPLLFFPVTLEVKENEWFLKTRKTADITLNKSFLLAYAHFNQVLLEEAFIETTFNDFDKESRQFRTELYEMLKDSPLELNFNQELFNDKLEFFKTYKKADLEADTKNGELKLFPQAVLGIFPQAGSYLVPDYDKMIERNKHDDLESFFVSRTYSLDDQEEQRNHSQQYFNYLNRVKEEQIFTPFPLDASQENALKAVKNGNSVVVQGPPGTGKSQLISAMVSDFIARGKKVLLVCQKRAALDVVHARLKEQEIGSFTALVHDFKNDRKTIYEQIDNQIDRIREYEQRNNSLDSIQLERTFLQASRSIDQLTEELEEFKNALFNDEECGISIKELYLTTDPSAEIINLKQEFKHFRINELTTFEQTLRQYLFYHNKLTGKNSLWKDRVSFAKFSITDLQKIKGTLEEVPEYEEKVGKKVEKLLGTRIKMEELEWVSNHFVDFNEFLSLTQDPKVYTYFQHLVDKNPDENWLLIKEKTAMECFREEGVEETTATERLGELQQALEKAKQASKSLVKWLFWKLFSKEKYIVKRAIVANGLAWSREGLKILSKGLDSRLNLEHVLSELKEKDWLLNVPDQRNKDELEEWFHYSHLAIDAQKRFLELRHFNNHINIKETNYDDLKSIIEKYLQLADKAKEKHQKWMKYLTMGQVNSILGDFNLVKDYQDSIEKNFDSLCEFDQLKEKLQEHEKDVIGRLLDTLKSDKEDEIVNLFTNSIKMTWIEHIETKYPILRSVSSMKIDRIEKELQTAIKEKKSVSREILLSKLRERTYSNVEYNRLHNMVTYRDLKHQVTKKRLIWPIRKLIDNFANELFDLIPCWMASPETVSALFPMERYFDLVIFDEASQCFVEKGMPSMYRANQIVVTGDDKQLSPNDLYQVRYEEDTEETPELEIDSLLDLSKKYLMEFQLMGHYRSKSLDLIDFSNGRFYKHTLRLLPDYSDANSNEPAIKYLKVDGMWENSRNEVEAEKVIEVVEELIADGKEDIGIVTFNFHQQQYIQDLLELKAIEKNFQIPDRLFVKNIENVQGDERDIIIFSIGYAPDKRGRIVMHFGSLNIYKGENRLNVAVTRAREKIYLVSSIMPQQLKVDDAKHDGPKALRDYLYYAWKVSEGEYTPQQNIKVDYHTNWFLKNKLKELAFTSDSNQSFEIELPFADITVKENGQYKALLLTDDDIYHQSISVKDSHAYIPLTLKKKKWIFKRLYSRQYWMDKEALKDDLFKYLQKNVKT